MIRHHVNPSLRLLILHYSGQLNFNDWRALASSLIAQNPEMLSFDCVVDLRALTDDPTSDEMRAHGQMMKKMGLHDRPRKQVVLAGSNLQFGLSRMMDMQTSLDRQAQYLTTFSIPKAAEWLGLTATVLQAELDAAADSSSPPPDGPTGSENTLPPK